MSKNLQNNYDKDFYFWALCNAELIRQRKFDEVDINHVVEELQSMGRSVKRELIDSFALLVAHLLRWQFQSAWRSNNWKSTIKEQRMKVLDLLEESPSLQNELKTKLDHIYEQAVLIAVCETGLAEKSFPKKLPFTLKQCFGYSFFPK